MHKIEGESALNLHDQTLYALRKDGHYDALFSIGAENDSESASTDAVKRVNANFIKPHMTDFYFDLDFNDVLDPKVDSQHLEQIAHEFGTYQKLKAGGFEIIPERTRRNSFS